VTLGYHYNWTNRTYSKSHYNQFPFDLAELTREIAKATGFSNYVPEAAIINFYGVEHSLCAHLDDVEETMDQPIVSVSFGNTGIFLIGGRSKDVKPTAIYVRSGDVIIMSGDSRCCYHGVPRILPEIPRQLSDASSPEFPDVFKYLSNVRINLNVRQVYQHHQDDQDCHHQDDKSLPVNQVKS